MLTCHILDAKASAEDYSDASTLPELEALERSHRAISHWRDAEDLNKQIIQRKTTQLGAMDQKTLTSGSNLSWALWIQGPSRWAEAEKIAEQVMLDSILTLGEEHIDTLVSFVNLATIWYHQSRVAESARLHIKTLEEKKRLFGEGSRDFRESKNWVGFLRSIEEGGALKGWLYWVAFTCEVQDIVIENAEPSACARLANKIDERVEATYPREAGRLSMITKRFWPGWLFLRPSLRISTRLIASQDEYIAVTIKTNLGRL